jgi:hypothetical protein
VIATDGEALVEVVASAVPPPGDPAPRLRPGIDAYLQFLAGHPHTWALMVRDPPRDPKLRRAHQRISDRVTAALRGLLAHPKKSREKPFLVDLVALAVTTYATWWQAHPEVPRSEIVEAIGDLAAAGARRIENRSRAAA